MIEPEDYRRDPNRSAWLCIQCGNPSKRAKTTPDRLCPISFEPGREVPISKTSVRKRRRANHRVRRVKSRPAYAREGR